MVSRDLRSLDQMMDGALVERFNEDLQRVMQNVFDMRTDPKKPRKISLIFTFRPNDRRDAAEMFADVKVVTAPPVSLSQTVLMSVNDNGFVTLTERTDQIPGQMDIDGNEKPLPKEISFKVIDNQ